jgi:hypothetical protein
MLNVCCPTLNGWKWPKKKQDGIVEEEKYTLILGTLSSTKTCKSFFTFASFRGRVKTRFVLGKLKVRYLGLS